MPARGWTARAPRLSSSARSYATPLRHSCNGTRQESARPKPATPLIAIASVPPARASVGGCASSWGSPSPRHRTDRPASGTPARRRLPARAGRRVRPRQPPADHCHQSGSARRAPGHLRRARRAQGGDRSRAVLPMAALRRSLRQRHGHALPPGPAQPRRRRPPGDLQRRELPAGQGARRSRHRAPRADRPEGLPAARGRRGGPDRLLREHWTKLRSTNPLERVNKEIGRRSDVVGIFPNDAAVIRLAGALSERAERRVARAAPLPVGRVHGPDPLR